MPKGLTREQILEAVDRIATPLKVPEWGDEPVYMTPMTTRERERYERKLNDAQPSETIRAEMAVLCVTDADGERLFERSDIGALLERSAPALERIFARGIRINLFTKEDVDALLGGSEADARGSGA